MRPARLVSAALTLVGLALCAGLTTCGGATEVPGSSDAGSGGSPGVDSGLAARCRLPAAPGNCLAYAPSYYHDARTGLCTPFVYGGCGGNDNRFATQEECQAACHGGTPDMDACTVPTDCILDSPGCCAACDPVDRTAFVALNRRYASDYDRAAGCEGVQCAPCQSVPEETRTSQYFVPTCKLGRCIAVDIRATPVTACASAADCHLRDGAACCEGCDGTGLVSIASEAALSALACGAEPVGCPPCVPLIPATFVPACNAGRCAVGLAP
jgi:hypothetical protein